VSFIGLQEDITLVGTKMTISMAMAWLLGLMEVTLKELGITVSKMGSVSCLFLME